MNRQLIGQAVGGLAAFFAAFSIAHAGSFSVNPVRVTLSAKQPVAAITVRNSGSEPAVIQLETSAWSQEEEKDVLVPSGDVLATPPIFTVAPGKAQILRIGLRKPSAAAGETTYRLVLREVPSSAQINGLRVALMISMPVFVVPAGAIAPKLEWRASRTADGQIRVRATNTGNAHIQLTKIELALEQGGKALGGRNVADYVLPGRTRSWLLKPSASTTADSKIQIRTVSDAGAFKSDVPLEIETAAEGSALSVPLASR
jgi:fimbrial chaperone protein